MNAFVLASIFFVTLIPGDETAIRDLIDGRESAWEKQDVEQLITPFAEDADYIDSSGTLTTGREAIEKNYKKIFASAKYKDSLSTQEIKKIRFVRPDVAVVDAEWTLTGLQSNDGKALPDRAGNSVIVLTKESDNWQIVTLRVALSVPRTQDPK